MASSVDKRADRLPSQPELVYQGELRDPEALARGGQVGSDDHALPYQVAMEQMGEELFVSMHRFGETVLHFSVSVHMGVPAMRFFEDTTIPCEVIGYDAACHRVGSIT